MHQILRLGVQPSELERGDIIIAVDGAKIVPSPTVLAVARHSAYISPNGPTSRTLYFDQHEEVVVERHVLDAMGGELKLDKEEVVAVMDALLLTAEAMEREGKPSALVRRAMRKVHFFSTPQVETDITISPRR